MSGKIDVIIPTYNNFENLKRCLHSFKNQSFQNFRILVCVDGSTDETLKWLQESSFSFEHKVLQHPNEENKGRNATRNLALPYLAAKFLVFLDSDMWVDRHFLSNHLSLIADGNTVSVGKVSYINRDTNLWASYLETRGAGRYAHGDTLPYINFVTGNSGLPTAIFKQLAGQDATMKTYGGGDTEFAIRLKKEVNIKLRYNELAFSESEMDKSLAFAIQQMEEFGEINLPYILKKHPEHHDLFRMNIILSNTTEGKKLRRLLSLPPKKLPEALLNKMPEDLRNQTIAWLAGKAILRGLKKSGYPVP